jgi:hypothetical protein
MLYIQQEMKNMYFDFEFFSEFSCQQRNSTLMLLGLFEIVLFIVLI